MAGAKTDIQRFTDFMRMSAPPPRPPAEIASTTNGCSVFAVIGRADCHTPTLKTSLHFHVALSRDVTLYSDLLLHNMGEGLQDDIIQGLANDRVFRTARLWGLGERMLFLHDGRTTDLIGAIEAHAGAASERNNVVAAYTALTEAEKQDRLNFLRTLCVGKQLSADYRMSSSELPLKIKVLSDGGSSLAVTATIRDVSAVKVRRSKYPGDVPVSVNVLDSGGTRLSITTTVSKTTGER